VATALYNLAELYTMTGKTEEAKELRDRAAKIRELMR